MNNNHTQEKQPLIHITKRAVLPTKITLAIRLGAIFLGLVFSLIVVTILTGKDPISVFGSMFTGAFGTELRIWNLLNETAILLGISLALTPAFKMKFWNCGAEGQVLVGGLTTATCMLFLGEVLPLPVLFIVMIISSMLAGAIWAVIPSIFRAFFGTNETLFTLMMNYIATSLVALCLKVWVKSGSGVLVAMPQYKFPTLFGQDYFLNVIVVLAICALMYIYLKYSKNGYEIAVVGESENTAKYVGINVKKVVIRTMVISGLICGLVGLLLVANGSCTITTGIVGGRGFTGIMVAWLAKFNPVIMIASSFLVAFLTRGSKQISTDLRLPSSIGEIITAIILLFLIGCEFFINYKVHIRLPEKEEEK